jgi:hypothetical protein
MLQDRLPKELRLAGITSSGNCTLIWPLSATTARTIAWQLRSRLEGRGNRNRRRAVAARSCRWLPAGRGVPVSTGRKIGRSSAASEPNCWALTSSSATAAPSFSGPIRSKSSPVVYGRGEGLSSLRQALGSAVVSINSLGRFSGGEYDVLRPSALRTEVCAEDGAS